MANTGIVVADSSDEQFLEGLRARRLFSLAAAHCRARLSDEQLAPGQRAQLTIELVRTFAEHAVNSSPESRAAFWKQAHDSAEEFEIRQRDNPRGILVRVQNGLTYLAHGELLRQEFEAGAGGSAARDEALKQLRAAAKILEDVDKDLTREIPRSAAVRGDELTRDELISLQNNTRFQLARTYRNRALCYDKESDDRLDALTRVLDEHAELQKKLQPDDPLVWQIRVDGIVCQRLLSNFAEARRGIVGIQSEPAPAKVQLRTRAEEVRLKLASTSPEDALVALQRGRDIQGVTSAELDFAHLETYEMLARTTQDKDEAARWQKQAVAMTEFIERTHGPYWGRRANLLLVRSATSGGVGKDLAILIRIADDSFLKGQYDQAVASYDKAAQAAASAKDTKQAFALFYKAALVEQKRTKHDAASRRLRELALAMPTTSGASDAHLLAAWNIYQHAKTDNKAVADYIDVLEEHVATWPEAASADRARIWLGGMREHQKVWNEAIDIYLEVSPSDKQFAEAVQAAARCARNHFAELKSSDQPYEEQAKLTAQRFESIVFNSGGQLPEQWSAAQQTSALTASQLRLQFTDGGRAEVATMLDSALKGSPAASKTWQTSVRSLLVVALASQQGRQADAAKLLQDIADASPDDLMDMLDGLSQIGQAASPSARVEMARLQLQAADLLASKEAGLSAASRLRFRRLRAAALAAADKRNDALAAYARLAADHKSNGPIQEAYAELLLAGDDVESLERALTQWRRVDRGSKPQTDRWFRAKYAVALTHLKLSDAYKTSNRKQSEDLKKRAALLLDYLKATPPGWENSSLKDDFEALLRRCGR